MSARQRFGLAAVAGFVLLLAPASAARAQVFETISSFAGCPAEGCGPGDDAARPGKLVLGPDGDFYAVSGIDWRPGEDTARDWGTIFRQRRDGSREILHRFDGTGPTGCGASRVSFGDDGALYGVGLSCYGYEGTAIFRLNGTSFEILEQFAPDGFRPLWIVAGSNGAFYGSAGAPNSTPQLFKWDGEFKMAFGRNAPDLQLAPDGSLYFIEAFHLPYPIDAHFGSINRLTVDDQVQLVEDFSWFDRIAPNDGLLIGTDGALYGTTTYWEQAAVLSRLYRMTLNGTFTYLPGPAAKPLAVLFDGSLLVLNREPEGGESISQRRADGTFVPLHTFSDTGSLSNLVRGPDGHFYGFRSDGGAQGLGVFFRIRVPSIDVKANGADGAVTVGAGSPLQISMAFDASATEIVDPSEVYLAVVTPALQIYWATAAGFSATPAPLYSGPLPSFPSTPLIDIPDAAVLPPGDYYWVAIVDADANGVPNGHYVDVVKTTKTVSTLRTLRR